MEEVKNRAVSGCRGCCRGVAGGQVVLHKAAMARVHWSAAVAGGLLRIRYALLCSAVVVSSGGGGPDLIFRQADPLRCPAVGGLQHAFLAPISPNLYWGK